LNHLRCRYNDARNFHYSLSSSGAAVSPFPLNDGRNWRKFAVMNGEIGNFSPFPFSTFVYV
jgi:hypothetical protein